MMITKKGVLAMTNPDVIKQLINDNIELVAETIAYNCYTYGCANCRFYDPKYMFHCRFRVNKNEHPQDWFGWYPTDSTFPEDI